jgi:hypothetical protein
MKTNISNMYRCIILALALIVIGAEYSYSQSNRWKRMRYDVIFGVGATNFLGELGGSDGPSGYIRDLEFSMTRPAYMIGARYLLTSKLGWQASVSHGILRGDDKKAGNEFRKERGLNFRTQIVEFGTRLEYQVFSPKTGSRYNLRNVRGKANIRFTADLFAGVACFYFNPKGYDEVTQKWYKLRPIGTEGQNYMETRSPYSRFSMSFPVGINAKYLLNRKWSVGLEYGIRPTLTDYIDDVSTSYADPELIAQHSGLEDTELAKRLADQNKNKYDENGKYVNMNQQRGNTYSNDLYMFMFVTVNYKLKTSRKGWPMFK